MADNVTITAGANSTPPDNTIVAADDVSGVKYQKIKLDLGGDGVSAPVVDALPVSGDALDDINTKLQSIMDVLPTQRGGNGDNGNTLAVVPLQPNNGGFLVKGDPNNTLQPLPVVVQGTVSVSLGGSTIGQGPYDSSTLRAGMAEEVIDDSSIHTSAPSSNAWNLGGRFRTAEIQMNPDIFGPFVNADIIFEVTNDGTNWKTCRISREDPIDGHVVSFPASVIPVQGDRFTVDVNGADQFRITCDTLDSGVIYMKVMICKAEFYPLSADVDGNLNISAGGGGLTDAELRATPVDVNITGGVGTGLTDTELRASPVIVDTQLVQAVTDAELRASPIDVNITGGAGTGLTDAELRATPVDVDTGLTQALTDTQLRASPVDVNITGGAGTGLTDTELRASPVPVSGPLTDTQLRATAVPVSGPLTDTQLRAVAVPISAAALPLPAGAATAANQTQPGVDIGDVTVNNGTGAAAVNVQDGGNSITVDGPVTDTQLRASPIDVNITGGAGTGLTDAELRASPVDVDTGLVQGLTDTQLRATPVPISDGGGTITVDGAVTANAGTNLNTSALALEAGNIASIKAKTDNIPPLGQALSAASTPVVLPAAQITTLTPPAAITGFATETTLAAINTKTPSLGQQLAAASSPVVLTAIQVAALTPPATITGFALETTQLAEATLVGAVNETAPASDTASSGLNGRLQRIAQRITSLIALLPAALDGSGFFKVHEQGTAAVSAASLPLPSGASTETTLAALNTKMPSQGQALAAASVPVVLTAAQITTLTPVAAITGFALETTQSAQSTLIGAVNETAPASDTASSGLNGRLQRIAQRITSLIALVPAALTGSGNFKVSIQEVTASLILAAGTALIGKVGIDQTTPGSTNQVRTGSQPISTAVITAIHVPTSNTKATISFSAGVGAVRNVCTGFTVTLAAGATAPVAVNLTVSLIDGASGGTTYLWRSTISVPAVAGAMAAIVRGNLWLPGTAATDMTLEFSAAGGANTIESVSMEGTTVSN